jgi:hypothetical protein
MTALARMPIRFCALHEEEMVDPGERGCLGEEMSPCRGPEGVYVPAEDLSVAEARIVLLQLQVDRIQHTLAEIQGRAWWENLIDPQWAARMARARLKTEALFTALASPRNQDTKEGTHA